MRDINELLDKMASDCSNSDEKVIREKLLFENIRSKGQRILRRSQGGGREVKIDFDKAENFIKSIARYLGQTDDRALYSVMNDVEDSVFLKRYFFEDFEIISNADGDIVCIRYSGKNDILKKDLKLCVENLKGKGFSYGVVRNGFVIEKKEG